MKLLIMAAALVSGAAEGGVYGDPSQAKQNHDTRRDLYEVTNPRHRELADSVIALVSADNVKIEGERALLGGEGYGESHGLCRGEKFYNQPSRAHCTGALVAPDVIMTAGHCVETDEECKGVKFVFGYGVKRKGRYPYSVPRGEVYSCAKVIAARKVEGKADDRTDDEDWALIRLDRKVRGHKPLAINASGSLLDYTPVFVIGHPSGLPTKVAPHGVVRDAGYARTFVASLDAYESNSGSPVFNSKTGLVEGILIAGDEDFVEKDGCKVSKVCATDDCGETVTKISVLSRLILWETAYAKTKPIFDELDKTLRDWGVRPKPLGAFSAPNFDGSQF